MHKLIFFVPASHKEIVKNSLFELGAGKIGNYDHCCFEAAGTGQFRPLEGSSPAVGVIGKVENCTEWKVEMVCADELIERVVAALKLSHPYETPAYEVYKILEI